MKHPRLNLSAVGYREGDWWILHCLELDIVAQGDTPEEALESLFELCSIQVAASLDEGDLAAIFKPAPPEFWSMYAYASTRHHEVTKPDILERFELRQVGPDTGYANAG